MIRESFDVFTCFRASLLAIQHAFEAIFEICAMSMLARKIKESGYVSMRSFNERCRNIPLPLRQSSKMNIVVTTAVTSFVVAVIATCAIAAPKYLGVTERDEVQATDSVLRFLCTRSQPRCRSRLLDRNERQTLDLDSAKMSNEASEPEDSIDIDLLGIVRRLFHWIALGALVGVTCGAIFYVKETPIYESRMSVLVGQLSTTMATTGVRDASTDSASLGEEALATHIELFRSPKVLQDAIERGRLNRSVGELREGLAVAQGGTASILTASYRDPDPESAVTILNAVFEAYQAYFDSQTRNVWC